MVAIVELGDSREGLPLDLRSAARRHFRSAVQLAEKREEAEACYLIGLAAECAVKAHLQDVGFPLERKKRKAIKDRKDPLFIHFPELATELLEQGEGLLGRSVLVMIGDRDLLNGWHVRMRYRHQASSPAIAKRYATWRLQTERIFAEFQI